jgi:hypothetical protein
MGNIHICIEIRQVERPISGIGGIMPKKSRNPVVHATIESGKLNGKK